MRGVRYRARRPAEDSSTTGRCGRSARTASSRTTEVDGIRWLPLDEAIGLLTYPHDVRVLRDFAALPPVTAVLAWSGTPTPASRGTWSGPDTARPLDAAGRAQAADAGPLLAR